MMSPHSSTRHGTLTTWCRQGTVWLSAAAAVLLLLPVALLYHHDFLHVAVLSSD